MDERGAKREKVDQREWERRGAVERIAGRMGEEKMSDGWTVFLLIHH